MKLLLLLTLLLPLTVNANEEINPYKIPTFTGAPVDWHKIKPAIEPLKIIDGDLLVRTITNCYPVPPIIPIDISLRAGATERPNQSVTIATPDAGQYYVGIVANMPLYSATEIDKEAQREYQRKLETAATVKALLESVALKRRAERMLGLYLSLEKRSQERVKQGIVSVDEQVGFLEKVASTQADLDQANATIEGSRLALVAQCRHEVAERVNNLIISEIN